jgi:hypothetical protein
MLVVQTAAEPPNHGKMHLLTINCTWKSKNALRNKVDVNSNRMAHAGFASKLGFSALEKSAVVELKLLSDKN